MLMNKETWESAPPDLQKIIERAARELADEQIEIISSKEAEMWKEFGQKVDCYSISPEEQARWRKAVGDLGDKHAMELSDKGYPGREALSLMRQILKK
jgi:TRAP-type C4-dicarboxylate transport system substrate-binding protein